MKNIFLLVYFCLIFSTLQAQLDSLSTYNNDTTDLSDMTIEELSQLKSRYKKTEMEKMVTQAIIAASRKPLSLKKSPSIVSVVTADDIAKSGARDIMDVFRLIPGIDFNIDVQGGVGLSFRGLWANEGKILLLLDGQEMNEIAYCTLVFGNNYNISQIRKIEVIRGPGSAIYGGFAEYAVINIISKSPEEINGINYDMVIGRAINTYARQNVSLTVGKRVNDFAFSMSTFIGKGQRSNMIYKDIDGHSFNMKNNSDLNPTNLNVSLRYKMLSVRLIYDMLATTTRDGYVHSMSKAYPTNFTNYLAEVKYIQKLGTNLQLQGKFNYKRSLPWEFNALADSTDNYPSYKIVTDRYRGNLAALWDATYWLNITAGAEAYYDKACKPILNGEMQIFRNEGGNEVAYSNYAAFLQSLIKLRFANLTIGARYDYNSASGAAFNPRLGITKRMGAFNFKLLYASSYRAPGIENIQTSIQSRILPEKTRTFELETGFQINRNMFLSLSLYDISTKNAIRYVVDTSLTNTPEGYINSDKKIGTQGLDLEYKYKSSYGFVNLAYAYYTTAHKSRDDSNEVVIDRSASLGIANHKFSIVAGAYINKYLYIAPSANFLGKRYGYSRLDSLGNLKLNTYKPNLQLNVYFGCTGLVKGLSFGMGVYNITNQEVIYIQPYKGSHGEYPGMGTEIIFKLTYNVPFSNKI